MQYITFHLVKTSYAIRSLQLGKNQSLNEFSFPLCFALWIFLSIYKWKLNENLIFFFSYLFDVLKYFSRYSLVPNCTGEGGQIPNFGKKPPQVHLIIIRECPKNTPPPYFKKSW